MVPAKADWSFNRWLMKSRTPVRPVVPPVANVAVAVVPVAALAGLDLTRVVAWGIRGLPPRARTWLDGLRALDGALRHGAGPDFVVRGGDGTVAGAGRLLVDGVRTSLT